MPRPKKRPWNADMKLPGYLGEPAHVVKPAPQTLTVGHSTAQHLPEPQLPHPNEMPRYAGGAEFRPLEEAGKRAAVVRQETIERAITTWAEQGGVTVERWLKVYGYTVETKWEGLSVTFVVKPLLGYPGQEVVFQQLPPAPSEQS